MISVGRLDYLSEGLLIITNDGELARALELPTHKIERSYHVRVFGRTFNDQKLAKLRKGYMMNGRQFGPYIVSIFLFEYYFLIFVSFSDRGDKSVKHKHLASHEAF